MIDAYSTIDQLGKAIRGRQISSLELTRFYLDRLEKHGPSLGAVVTIMREQAEREARERDAELAAGKSRGPLHGIPYGAKDLVATKGVPTTWGAEPYRNQILDYDATVVARLREAGAVLISKLAMVELAGGFGYNNADASFTGPGRTPWNTDFWSGGSSSGPGAAVAAGLVPFAIGSETSGSILTPSAFSGVSGFRPTYGLVSRHGAMALCWTLDKLGPMCRSAADCTTVMEAIAGPDPRDATSVDEKIAWREMLPKRKHRIAIVQGSTEKVQPEVRENFLRSVEVLKAAGHETVEISFPEYPYGPAVSTIVDAEGASAFEDLIRSGRAKMLRVKQDRVGGFEQGATLAVDYIRAQRVRAKIRSALVDLLATVDFIVSPTRASVSYPIGIDFEKVYPDVSGGPPLIPAMNLVGAPAISVPNGFGANNLPTALQIIASPMKDAAVIALASAYQEKTDFHRRKPPGF